MSHGLHKLALAVLLALLCAGSQEPSRLTDYDAWDAAEAAAKAGNREAALAALRVVLDQRPSSPLLPRAAPLAARLLLDSAKPAEARDLLKRLLPVLNEPEALSLLAAAEEAAGNPEGAASARQRLYFYFPASEEAAQLPAQPGTAALAFDRADRLLKARQYAQAKKEFAALDSDLARVRACAADYNARRNEQALRCLNALVLENREASAERLWYLTGLARRSDNDAMVERHAAASEAFAGSSWRLKTLISAADHFMLKNAVEAADRWYGACLEGFSANPEAAWCHWRLAWSARLRGAPEAAGLMAEHAARFPMSQKSAASLFFSGRYAAVLERYPNSWYAMLARGKAVVKPPPGTLDWTANAVTRVRIDRARVLAATRSPEEAQEELRWGGRRDEGIQGHVLALEAAAIAEKTGQPAAGVRAIKAMVPGYLLMHLDAAPRRFWYGAFPLAWREALQTSSVATGLDPFLVSALIRQESEWDPRARSRAGAYGIMQVMPPTGRQLSRQLGIRPFRTARLFEPELNLRLGTHHLSRLLDSYEGRQDAALAAYNAGKTRSDLWLSWWGGRDPVEFTESIPFTETRGYVQSVLRNADLYRRLYAAEGASQ